MDPETAQRQALAKALRAAGLRILGGLHEAGSTLLLIGPDGAQFWGVLQSSPEFQDGLANSIDRYSKRIISTVARDANAEALFPFGGPPYQPFIGWALKSGQCFQSPVQLLVHTELGLFVSFRGALRLSGQRPLPAPASTPCESCAAKPCLTACPANALNQSHYNVALCHDYLDTEPEGSCMVRGCAVRRACPIGQAERPEAQSAFHMKSFHKRAVQ